jgi:hypothetical protein
MDLTALKSKLGDDYAALDTYVNDLIGARDAARKEFEQGRKALKARVEALEALKTRLFDRLGLVSEEEIETLPDAKAAQGQSEALKQLEARLKRMENDLTAKAQAYQELQTAHRSARLDATLAQALNKYDFVDPEIVAAYLKGRMVWDGDEPRYPGDNGASVPLAEGVTLLAQTRPQLLKTKLPGGSGYLPHQGAPPVMGLDAEFASTPALQTEFGDVETYKAFKKAEASGAAHIIQGKL